MAERKHRPLDPAEAQALGMKFNSSDPEAGILQLRYEAERSFRRLEAVEQAAARVPVPEGVDRRGAAFRKEQLRRDANALGLAGHTSAQSHVTVTKSEDLADSTARVETFYQGQKAHADVVKAQAEYDRLAAAVTKSEAELALKKHERLLNAKRQEHARAMSAWLQTPANGELKNAARKLEQEIEQLAKNPPK